MILTLPQLTAYVDLIVQNDYKRTIRTQSNSDKVSAFLRLVETNISEQECEYEMADNYQNSIAFPRCRSQSLCITISKVWTASLYCVSKSKNRYSAQMYIFRH